MNAVEAFGLVPAHAHALGGNDAQAGLLQHLGHRAGEVAAGGVGLDDRKGARRGHDRAISCRWRGWIWTPPTRGARLRQDSALPQPFATFACPVAPFDAFSAGEQLPGESRALERLLVKLVETAVIRQRRLSPCAVGNQHVPRLVGRIGTVRKQDRLSRVVRSTAYPVRQEARRRLVPQKPVEASEKALVLRNDQQSPLAIEHLLGDARDHLFGGSARKL